MTGLDTLPKEPQGKDVKLCIRCLHSQNSGHICKNPVANGSLTDGTGFCDSARSDFGPCGKGGKFWEPRGIVISDCSNSLKLKEAIAKGINNTFDTGRKCQRGNSKNCTTECALCTFVPAEFTEHWFRGMDVKPAHFIIQCGCEPVKIIPK